MNVSFGKLYDDVVTLTNRPEAVSETQLAIRNATQFFHMIDFWKKDSLEDLLQYANPSFLFIIDVPAALPRFRKLRYLKKFDLSTLTPREGEFHKMSEVDPNNLFDRYNSIKQNVYYLAGTNLNVRSSTQEQGLLISWYGYPVIDMDNYQSWIADCLSQVIVNRAVAEVQNSIGMTEESNRRLKWSQEVDVPLVRAQDVEITAG